MEIIAGSYHFGQESFRIEAPEEFIPSIEGALRSQLPLVSFGAGRALTVEISQGRGPKVRVCLENGPVWSIEDEEILDQRYGGVDRKRRLRERVRLGVLRVVEEAFHLAPSPWGILMGVRPAKMVHSLFERGFSRQEVEKQLLSVYGLAPEKAGLLLEVAQGQRRFFHSDPNQPVSLYIGIPFCPTRCDYCSFAAYPLASHGHLLAAFFQALQAEIRALGTLLRELQVEVESIYVGGGTPTVLPRDQLEQLLELIRDYLTGGRTSELTVEAGRPETLSREMLAIIKKHGVDRICINPQSMHDRTLQSIGRGHSVQDVRQAMELAREAEIPVINMDIILGLPGETPDHVQQTMEQIEMLQPDQLTVHSLALKRASRLKSSAAQTQIAQEQGAEMGSIARMYALKWGMRPYYLYRQRHIFGGLENIGYTLPGLESVYNVQMMEERQSILGLGGGAITKLVAADLTLIRLVNPKCPATYTQQIQDDLSTRIDQIRRHFFV